MSQPDLQPDLRDAADLKVVDYEAGLVPYDVWEAAQMITWRTIRNHLGPEDGRADSITRIDDPAGYRASRRDPQSLVGREWNAHQLHRNPRFTGLFDKYNKLVGGVLTAENSSSSLPLPPPLRAVEAWTKYLLPSVLPGITPNRRYVHLREVMVDHGIQTKADKCSDADSNGVALIGLYYSLVQRKKDQTLTAYAAPDDPADRELTLLTSAIGMHETARLRDSALPGYIGRKIRLELVIEQALANIRALPGAEKTIGSMAVSVVSKKSIRDGQNEDKRRNTAAYWRDYEARHTTGSAK
jgi:hypothetical protein